MNMTLKIHCTLILQINTNCIAKYIDSKMSLNSISDHLFFWGTCTHADCALHYNT